MDYKKILELLNKKNVIKVKLIIIDGNEIIITKKDILEKDEGNLVIRRDTEHIAIPLDEIDDAVCIYKTQILSFERPSQRNRH
ncbi:hypothetical protein [Methanobrevibacter sp. UBA212]|uniref:hypothetical protein n=1 Tax=Methanobrevibacter sp. UBA212 TaxID=1915476 RepID=UPI0025D5D592|nr:hypothetical protein [Methanobrevibacter sp. UBA212]